LITFDVLFSLLSSFFIVFCFEKARQ